MADVEQLAELNRQLIVDEGHPNPMTLAQLRRRMQGWLEAGQHQAVLFRQRDETVAYCLYCDDEWGRIHIRQLLVVAHSRRRGIGRRVLSLMQEQIVSGKPLVLEVLSTNQGARAFYDACGFRAYAVTLLRNSRQVDDAK